MLTLRYCKKCEASRLSLAGPLGILFAMDEIETPQQRRARIRRGAADRARAYRSRHRITGRPLPRDCDNAIVEGLAYWLESQRRSRGLDVAPPDLAVPVRELLKIAGRILVERAGADKAETICALGRRVGPRDEHDYPGYVPELPRAPSRS